MLSTAQSLQLNNVDGMEHATQQADGRYIMVTLISYCVSCQRIRRWFGGNDIGFEEFTVDHPNAPILTAVRRHLGLSAGTPIEMPLIFNPEGEFLWNGINNYEMMKLKKHLHHPS